MATFDKKSFLVIFVFWVALPSLDVFSDIKLFHKFFKGPAPDTVFYVKGIVPFPEPYNIGCVRGRKPKYEENSSKLKRKICPAGPLAQMANFSLRLDGIF